ncbi:MAG: SAM-dependent chlorinase/fluorinase [Nitrososphaeria archaeon]
MRSPPIVLFTDFGEGSIYVGEMKGIILKVNPSCTIVDLTHNIPPQNVLQGAFLLKETFRFFPRQSIFVCVVDPEVGSTRKNLAIKTRNFIFLGPDNGILFPAVREDRVDKVVSIENKAQLPEKISPTFHGRDVFAYVAAKISKGLPIEELGPMVREIKELAIPVPHVEGEKIVCKVLFIDSFGNIVTNLKRVNFRGKLDESLEILIRGSRFTIPLVRSYHEVKENQPLTLFNSFDCLEIAVNRGNASKCFKVKCGDTISIKIGKEKNLIS